jgi:dihydroorotate dehydrogenase (NAD+) catalytic subunit
VSVERHTPPPGQAGPGESAGPGHGYGSGTIEFCGLRLAHPVINASGTFDLLAAAAAFGEEVLRADFPFAAFVSKTITLQPRAGNPPPRLWEASAGLINSIGLPNKGLEGHLTEELPRIAELLAGVPLITNVMGATVAEIATLLRRCDARPEIAALELNVSCPNVKTGLDIGADPAALEAVLREARPVTTKPLIVKLTPNTANVADCARAAQAGGADAVSLINTLRAMALEPAPSLARPPQPAPSVGRPGQPASSAGAPTSVAPRPSAPAGGASGPSARAGGAPRSNVRAGGGASRPGASAGGGAPRSTVRAPWLGGRTGGLSGPAIRAVALAQVAAVAAAVEIPVVGMGGVQSARHARDLLDAGATLVAVGTENFRDPAAGARIARELAGQPAQAPEMSQNGLGKTPAKARGRHPSAST